LEFYDFIIFVFFANQIGRLFFPAEIPDWLRLFQTFGLFAVAYLVRPLSGTIMGHFGDLIGRKRIFTFSILLMAVPTLAIGLLPSYSAIGIFAPIALLILRVLQGAAIGGEIPGAWVFVSEHVPSNRVSLACGTLTAGLTAGILLGSVVNIGITRMLPPAEVTRIGWRIAFLLGGVFGICAALLPRWEFQFDHEPAKAVETRIRVFDQIAQDRHAILACHFPFPGLGHLRKDADGYIWVATPIDLGSKTVS
jgi:MFS family permease